MGAVRTELRAEDYTKRPATGPGRLLLESAQNWGLSQQTAEMVDIDAAPHRPDDPTQISASSAPHAPRSIHQARIMRSPISSAQHGQTTTALRICTSLLELLVFALAPAWSQSLAQAPSSGTVTAASYEHEVHNDLPRTIRFARRAPQIGDQLEQTLAFEVNLHQIMRQGEHLVEQGELVTRRHQCRMVTTTDVADGTAVAALVRYSEATKQTITAQDVNELRTLTAPIDPQPVKGKAYRCRRTDKKLQIADEQGNIPPLDEFKIVAQNMETLGRVNPLAEFLAGRTVSVGEKLSLPHEVAERLLGLGDELGQVSRFELLLKDVKTVSGVPCAFFDASIDAASTNASQMRMQVDGPLVIEATTCRAVEAKFNGPIGMSETRGSLTETYQMSGTGRISVSIATAYRDVSL
jgi:hypothetical protein